VLLILPNAVARQRQTLEHRVARLPKWREVLNGPGSPIRCCTFATLLSQLGLSWAQLLSLNARYGLILGINVAAGNL
jgi:hypothetical protein